MRLLLGNQRADEIILSVTQLLIGCITARVLREHLFQTLGPQQTSNLIDTHEC
jgi:hypothetical protein